MKLSAPALITLGTLTFGIGGYVVGEPLVRPLLAVVSVENNIVPIDEPKQNAVLPQVFPLPAAPRESSHTPLSAGRGVQHDAEGSAVNLPTSRGSSVDVGGQSQEFVPQSSTGQFGSTISGGTAAPSEILMPAALVPESADIAITEEQQVVEWEKLQDDFLAEVDGVVPETPLEREAWISAREYSDTLFRAKFGTQAFLQQSMEAYRRGLDGL